MNLSKKERQIIKKAMEIIEENPIWSCWALENAEKNSSNDNHQGTELTKKYIKFFSVQKNSIENIWLGLPKYIGHKKERLTMLAMFLEAAKYV